MQIGREPQIDIATKQALCSHRRRPHSIKAVQIKLLSLLCEHEELYAAADNRRAAPHGRAVGCRRPAQGQGDGDVRRDARGRRERAADGPLLASASRDIAKDIKRTFPWMESYASRESTTRNVLLAYAHLAQLWATANRSTSSLARCSWRLCLRGRLLLARHHRRGLAPPRLLHATATCWARASIRWFSRAASDQPASAVRSPRRDAAAARPRLAPMVHVPLCKGLALSLVLRVWDVVFVYGDHALFAVALAMLHMAEARLLRAGASRSHDCLRASEAARTIGTPRRRIGSSSTRWMRSCAWLVEETRRARAPSAALGRAAAAGGARRSK